MNDLIASLPADALWHNVPGAIPPSWVQGRGFGESGDVLHIISRDEVLRVAPGDVLMRAPDGEPVILPHAHARIAV